MIHILCSYSNFDQPWAYNVVEPYIQSGSKVCVLPLSHSDGWMSEEFHVREQYEIGSDGYETLVRPFRSFGIRDQDIHFVQSEDSREHIVETIEHSDILVLLGSHPEAMMDRIHDLKLESIISKYAGVVMGISAGVLIQLARYHMTADYFDSYGIEDGLGLLEGFAVDVHYVPEVEHLSAMIRVIEDENLPVICIPEKGLLVIDHGYYEMAGDCFVVSPDNLDELYAAYEEMQVPYGW